MLKTWYDICTISNMKTLIILALLFCSCSKIEKECKEYYDIRGELVFTCCGGGINKEKKLCKCDTEYFLLTSSMTESEKKAHLKQSCQ